MQAVLSMAALAGALVLVLALVLPPVTSVWTRWPAIAPWLLAALALALWALLRRLKFWQPARTARLVGAAPPPRRLLAPHDPRPVSAAVMGLAGGLLYATQGTRSCTNHLRTGVLHTWSGGAAASQVHNTLVVDEARTPTHADAALHTRRLPRGRPPPAPEAETQGGTRGVPSLSTRRPPAPARRAGLPPSTGTASP